MKAMYETNKKSLNDELNRLRTAARTTANTSDDRLISNAKLSSHIEKLSALNRQIKDRNDILQDTIHKQLVQIEKMQQEHRTEIEKTSADNKRMILEKMILSNV